MSIREHGGERPNTPANFKLGHYPCLSSVLFSSDLCLLSSIFCFHPSSSSMRVLDAARTFCVTSS